MPVLKVEVEVEVLVQHNFLESLQQTDDQVEEGLMWSEEVVKLPDVCCQMLQGRLSEDGAVVAEEGGLSAVQVNLCVVGLGSAGQPGSQLTELPVCTMDKLGAVVRIKPHRGVGAGVRANRPRLVIDPSLVIILDPAGHFIKLFPWRGEEHKQL